MKEFNRITSIYIIGGGKEPLTIYKHIEERENGKKRHISV